MDLLLSKLYELGSDSTHTSTIISNEVITYLAEKLLIDDEGNLNQSNIQWLEQKGFPVVPWERDRSRWLVGAIETNKGFILFA